MRSLGSAAMASKKVWKAAARCCTTCEERAPEGQRGKKNVGQSNPKTWQSPVSRSARRAGCASRRGARARGSAAAQRTEQTPPVTWLAKRTLPGSVGSDSAPASAAARGEAPSALCALCALATSSARSAVKSLKRRRTSISPCSLRAASPYLRMDSASRSAHAGLDSHTSGHARPERGSRSQQVGHWAQPAVRV